MEPIRPPHYRRRHGCLVMEVAEDKSKGLFESKKQKKEDDGMVVKMEGRGFRQRWKRGMESKEEYGEGAPERG